jgi:predicted SAM-dependent methyltransferase
MSAPAPFRLHIGGQKPLDGWKILDIMPGPFVDYVGDCADLSQFEANSIDELYLSHVLEHLGHNGEFEHALKGFFRVLKPGGSLLVGVPNMKVLCELFLAPETPLEVKFGVVNILFGGQKNVFDFHKAGFDEDLLHHFLQAAGFNEVERLTNFGLIDDASTYEYAGRTVSLNMRAKKPHAATAILQVPESPKKTGKEFSMETQEEPLIFGPIFNIPDKFLRDFSMQGRTPILMQFRYETSGGNLTWSKVYWDMLQPKIDRLIESGQRIGYSSDPHMMSLLNSFPVRGKSVVVIGSVHPLYEAIVSRMGGIPSTVEFRKIHHDIPGLNTYTVEEFQKMRLQFDCGVTISALEHDGLGRYGDPIDPLADLKTMKSYKKIIKRGGLMFLSVPVGQDAVCWNSHRIYGRHRLPMLLDGWKILGHSGFEESLFDLGRVGEDYKEPVFVLENI